MGITAIVGNSEGNIMVLRIWDNRVRMSESFRIKLLSDQNKISSGFCSTQSAYIP